MVNKNNSALEFIHVVLGFFFTISLIGSLYSVTYLSRMKPNFKLFLYLILFLSSAFFVLLQMKSKDANVAKRGKLKFILGAHLPLGFYFGVHLFSSFPLSIQKVFRPSLLIPLILVIASQFLDKNKSRIFSRLTVFLLGVIVSYISIIIMAMMLLANYPP